MIIIENSAGLFEEEKQVFMAIPVDAFPLELERTQRFYQTEEIRLIPYQQTWWLENDKTTGIEFPLKKEARNWNVILPYGDTSGGNARVSPNDISYTKTRF